jgi:hypothetical protein
MITQNDKAGRSEPVPLILYLHMYVGTDRHEQSTDLFSSGISDEQGGTVSSDGVRLIMSPTISTNIHAGKRTQDLTSLTTSQMPAPMDAPSSRKADPTTTSWRCKQLSPQGLPVSWSPSGTSRQTCTNCAC